MASCSKRYNPLDDWSDRKRHIDKRGYVRVHVPEHPRAFCGGWVYEHRLVAEKRLGRLLSTKETVHHISERKDFNEWRNLFVCYREEHNKAHGWAYAFS